MTTFSQKLSKNIMKKLFLIFLITPAFLLGQTPLERLEKSPRHHEWVDVTYGDRTVRSFLVYPERSEKTPVVIVIHENRGLNDWARSMADQLAEAGYIAPVSYTHLTLPTTSRV